MGKIGAWIVCAKLKLSCFFKTLSFDVKMTVSNLVIYGFCCTNCPIVSTLKNL